MEVKITKDNFEEEVLKSDKTVLLDFWATWCGPCMMLSPILKEIADENENIKIGKINVDEEGELAKEFGVVSIPMLVLFKDGKQQKYTVGYMPKEKVLEFIGC